MPKLIRTKQEYEAIASMLNYDAQTGVFVWAAHHKNAGAVAGSTCGERRILRYKSTLFVAARVAWFVMTGEIPAEVDHKNRNAMDDRYVNLRSATRLQNAKNVRHSTNASGFPGVVRASGCDRWQAQISVDGRHVYLGMFKTIEEAIAVRAKAMKEHHGDFAAI